MNAPPKVTSTTQPEGWQESRPQKGPPRVRLYLRRATLLLLFLVLLSALAYFLVSPWFRPRTHLVVLPAGAVPVLQGTPVAGAGDENALFDPLQSVLQFHRGEHFDDLLSSRNQLDRLSNRLAELQIREPFAPAWMFGALRWPGDRVILYVNAHGVTFNDGPFLVCGNFDPSEPEQGLYPVQRLLTQIRAGLPRDVTKLLVLDAGQLDFDPRLGIIVNDFSRRLNELVAQTGDDKLWVLSSHSTGQKSHRSSLRGGSLFGASVAEGLQGEADLDADGSVDTLELEQFVSQQVSAWVDEATEGEQGQNPLLRWGGEGNVPRADVLSLGGGRAVSEPDLPQEFAVERPAVRSRGLLARTARVSETSLSAEQAGPEDSAAAGMSQAPSPPDDDGSVVEAAADKAGDEAEDQEAKVRQQLGELIAAAWRWRDHTDTADRDLASLSRVIDNTPHLWRELQEELVAYEHALQRGAETDFASMLTVLETALPGLFQTSQVEPGSVPGLMLADRQPGLRDHPFELSDLRSLALAKLARNRGWHEPAEEIDELLAELDGLIRMPAQEFTEWVAAPSWQPAHDQYYELRLLKELAGVAGVEPKLFQLALRTRRECERVAALEPWCGQWLPRELDSADRLRLAGERQLFDQIGTAWPQRAESYFAQALAICQANETLVARIRMASRLRNDLVFRAPYYVRWHRLQQSDDSLLQLADFLETLLNLADVLDTPAPGQLDSVSSLSRKLGHAA